MLKSSMGTKVEREPGRLPQYTWQKEGDKKLAEAKKLKREMNNKKLIELTELDHNEVEQPSDVEYPNSTATNHEIVLGKPLKRKPLTTIAHNYTFWADLIFEPESRERGMVLFVEGTSRWCWCHPFIHKNAAHIAAIIRRFINLIDENHMPCDRWRK